MSKMVQAKTPDKDRYWSGVFTGVFLGCFIISVMVLVFIRIQGLKVAINPQKLARMVQVKVQDEAKRDIPQLLEGIKKELPNDINENLESLEELTIGIGKNQVGLPAELIAAIKGEFNRVIEEAIINTINNYDTVNYEERIGRNAYELVEATLNQDIIGNTYMIKANEWFSVPVKIIETSKQHFGVGI